MPVGTRMNNTFQEMLPKLHQLINEMKMTQDADYEWLINLETQVLSKVKEPYDAAAQATAQGAPSQGMPGGTPQDPMQAMMAGAGQMSPQAMSRGPVQGVNRGPAVDELTRMMGGTQ